MPHVPIYNGKIKERNLPIVRSDVNPPIEAFGGGRNLGEAERHLIEFAQKTFEAEKKSADKAALMDLDNQLTSLEIDLLHNNEYGALNKMGKNSIDASRITAEAYVKGTESIGKNAPGYLRGAFNEMATNKWLSMDRQIQNHAAAQQRKMVVDTAKAYVGNQINLASMNPTDEKLLVESAKNIGVAYGNAASITGDAPDVVDMRTQEAVSEMLKQSTLRLLSTGDFKMAESYYAKHFKEMLPDDTYQVAASFRTFEQMIRLKETGYARKSNPDVLVYLDNLAETNPAKFLEINVDAQFGQHLKDSDVVSIRKLQTDVRKGIPNKAAKIVSDNKPILDDLAIKAGLNPRAVSPKTKTKYLKYYMRMREKLAETIEWKHPPTEEDVKNIASGLLKKTGGKYIFETEYDPSEITQEKAPDALTDDVRAFLRNEIWNYKVRNGMKLEVSEEEIQRAFRNWRNK